MSDALFPTLQGLTFDIAPVPTFSTVVQRAKNRATTRLMSDPYPLWTFELTFEFLRDSTPQRPGGARNPSNYSELEQIVGFYLARGGGFDDFLLDPGMLTGRPQEWQAQSELLGLGDGLTTIFQLQRNIGGFSDEVQAPAGQVFLFLNGAPQTTGWTLGAAGAIVFNSAPAAGVRVTADFRWRWRVRFAEDTLGLQQFMFQLYELQKLKLEQVKL